MLDAFLTVPKNYGDNSQQVAMTIFPCLLQTAFSVYCKINGPVPLLSPFFPQHYHTTCLIANSVFCVLSSEMRSPVVRIG